MPGPADPSAHSRGVHCKEQNRKPKTKTPNNFHFFTRFSAREVPETPGAPGRR